MGSLTRAPKMHKPTKGMKQYMRQGLKSFKRALSKATGDPTLKENWNRPKEARARWLSQFMVAHNAHQGGKECARRVRQMREHKCIDPGSWV